MPTARPGAVRAVRRVVRAARGRGVALGFLGGMLLLLGAVFGPLPSWPSALLVWAGAVLAFGRLDRTTRRLVLLLLAIGAAATLLALARGQTLDIERLLGLNLAIAALFIGLAFLSLARPPGPLAADEPRRGGALITVLSVHLVGAVVNMAILAIAGDQMARDGRLARPQAVVLARAYCAAAFWSPFFVASAVAHTYAPGADYRALVPLGLAAAAVALLITVFAARSLSRPQPFDGFAPDRRSVVLTTLLLCTVLLLKQVLPAVPMVIIVTAVVPVLSLLMIPRALRGQAPRRLLDETLPATASQVSVFLAAGVFAYGVALLLGTLDFAGTLASPLAQLVAPPLALALILLSAYAGIHPVISIAALSSVVLPLQVDDTQMAFAYLAGWAIGTAVAPLSGMNLFLRARYGVQGDQVVRWGPGYAAMMFLVVSALMALS